MKIQVFSIVFLLLSQMNYWAGVSYENPNLGSKDNSIKLLEYREDCPEEGAILGLTGKTVVFKPDISSGKIGQNAHDPVDQLHDNLFHFHINTAINPGDKVYLAYRLKGVENHTAVSRSWNDELSIGGYLVNKTDYWTEQKERIHPNSIELGHNVLRFHTPAHAQTMIQVKDVKLVVEKSVVPMGNLNRSLQMNWGSQSYYGDQAYLKGVLLGPGCEEAVVRINKERVTSQNGTFEFLLNRPFYITNDWEVEVTATFKDGETIEIKEKLKRAHQAHHCSPFEAIPKPNKKLADKGQSSILAIDGANLTLSSGTLLEKTLLAIQPLRKKDLPPLDVDLINVTKKERGYRFLPDGHQFLKDAQLSIEYDPELIPKGYTAHDIQTFYFNEKERKWEVLAKDTLLEATQSIQSRTTHFTDFINGIIVIPESPQSQGFTPTFVKDLDVADPSAGIVSIQPPQANSMGTAGLDFPLKLPVGRKGMMPNLAIEYNSDWGLSWLGLGWDIVVPAVGIETNWGVPEYLPDYESETYSFNGVQLAPVAHRGPYKPRVSNQNIKVFYPRVDDQFQKIIRHGNHPSNYWWEVTSKNGSKQFFGGRTGVGVIENGVLRDDRNNIAHWALVETRDLDNNFIKYDYNITDHPGILNSTISGRQIYLESISYTGHGNVEGKYRVEFFRKSDRKDISIDARLGFKRVTADLLERIEISFNGQVIRSYELTYQEGAFFKNLLTGIAELDKQGNSFYEHEFEYYDDIRNGNNYQPFESPQEWEYTPDNVMENIFSPLPWVNGKTSMLGGSKSRTVGGGSSFTVGLYGNPFAKTNTVGGNYNYAESTSEGMISLMDISGDGLPDKLFIQSGQLYYRENNGENGFGSIKEVGGPIKQFEYAKTKSHSGGPEAHPGGAFVGYTVTGATTTTSNYFIDLNGDGLIDVASNEKGYFSYINEQGTPTFTSKSGLTPSPIKEGDLTNVGPPQPTAEETNALIDQFPLHDMVRMWVAPCDGVITVEGGVQLIGSDSEEALAYRKSDGVTVSIQLSDRMLWKERLKPDGPTFLTPNPTLGEVEIKAGERLYFRVQSILDGAFDQVSWDPVITYLNQDPQLVDANKKTVFRYQASEDFLLTSCQTANLPFDGQIKVRGVFSKPITSDEVLVQVIRIRGGNETILSEHQFGWDQEIMDSINLDNQVIRVEESDEILFRVKSQTNVDWSSIAWTPQVYYTSTDNGVSTNGLSFCPAPEFTMYNQVYKKTSVWVAPDTATYEVFGGINISNVGFPNTTIDKQFEVTFSVKGKGLLYGKSTLNFQNGLLFGDRTIEISLNQGDSVYFEYHMEDDLIPDFVLENPLRIFQSNVVIQKKDLLSNEAQIEWPAGVFIKTPENQMIFGPLYRGWGYFGYNGNRGRADEPIRASELNLNEYKVDEDEIGDVGHPDEIDVDFDPATLKFILLTPNIKTGRWEGFDDLTYINGTHISSSRYGEDDVSGQGFVNVGSNCKYVPLKISKSNTKSISAGLGVSGSKTDCTTRSIIDYMDLNGDRYPDIVYEDRIVYTSPTGGYAKSIDYPFESHVAQSSALGAGYGGNPGNSNTSNSGNAAGAGSPRSSIRGKSRSGKLSYNAKESTESASGIGGLSSNLNFDNDWAVHSWMDMNGDGLPDKVFRNGKVALNLGYSFSKPESWGFDEIRSGQSVDLGVGLGINLFNGSFEAGVSSSLTLNLSKSGLQDVNGDGLVDLIQAPGLVDREISRLTEEVVKDLLPKQNLKVKLNTGNGFSEDWIDWPGTTILDGGSSVAESANTAITGCIPIPFIGIRICINPNGSIGKGVGRQENQLNDIDGDGFVDFLESSDDGSLTVSKSKIGRTNLLKSVIRPFGATIELDYALVGHTVDLPFGKWVLASVSEFDGLTGDGADYTKYSFEYEDGFFDRHERAFYGFRTVNINELDTEREDAIYRTNKLIYRNQDYYSKGLMERELLLDSMGRIYTEASMQYELRDRLSGVLLPPGFERSDTSAVFPALVTQLQAYYEGQPDAGLETKTTYEYDLLGNVIQYMDFGDGTPEDLYTAEITYHDNDAIYLKNSPASIKIITQHGVMRRKETEINEAGNLIKIRQYLDEQQYAEYDMSYNQYGLLTKLIRPKNHQNKRLVFEYQYDDVVQTFQTGIKDSYGYQSSYEYEYEFGQVLKIEDINNQVSKYTIDEKGRITSFVGPYELAENQPYTILYEYHNEAGVPYALTKNFDPEHQGDIMIYSFVDGLFRPIQLKKSFEVWNANSAENSLQLIVSGRVKYDAFGRVVEAYHPTLQPLAEGPVFSRNYDPVQPQVQHFDLLDRNLKTVLRDGSIITESHSIGTDNNGYKAFKNLITDPMGHLRESYIDLRGRNKTAGVQGPDGMIWTNFYYNALSELTKVVDDHQNETAYTYDHFGRQMTMVHPDGGKTQFKYDLVGNHTHKITSNIEATLVNAAVEYTYDYERLVGIDYPLNYQNKVQIAYGAPGAKHNRAGRIELIQDASGGQEWFYGPLGETIKTIRTILTSEGNVRTFVSEQEYDTWNRVQKMIYPDGEQVLYHYNKGGSLQGMISEKMGERYPIIEQIGYDKFEQQIYCKYGNGIEKNYSYEPDRRRMNQLHLKDSKGNALLDLQFQFDPVSNILQISNPVTPQIGRLGGSVQHQYQYDELYRLTSANGSWQGQGNQVNYELNLQYDNLHNILQKTQTINTSIQGQTSADQLDLRYFYDSSQPNAPSEIGTRKLEYDQNGNLVEWQDSIQNQYWQLVWDEENRITGTSNNGHISKFTYDYAGERVVKSHKSNKGVFINGHPVGSTASLHDQNYTAYVSPFFVAKENQFTKHYYVGEQRILSKLGTGEFHNDYWYTRGLTAGNKNYVYRMQLLHKAYRDQLGKSGNPPNFPGYHHAIFLVHSDSLPDYDNSIPEGWPTQVPIDTSRPPGEPGLNQTYRKLDNDNVKAGYGFREEGAPKEINQFFYHGDHLGSIVYITDINGEIRQETQYTPFGQSFVDRHLYDTKQPYLFNGKEQDEVTGLYYYGARYYDPTTSLWLGVDPKANQLSSWSPYVFSFQNPVSFVDSDGKMPGDEFDSEEAAARDFGENYNGKYILRNKPYTGKIYQVNGKYLYRIDSPKGKSPKQEGGKFIANLVTGDDNQAGERIIHSRRRAWITTRSGSLYKNTRSGKTLISRSMPSDPSVSGRHNNLSPLATNLEESNEIKKRNRKFQIAPGKGSPKRQITNQIMRQLGYNNSWNDPSLSQPREKKKRSNNRNVRFKNHRKK